MISILLFIIIFLFFFIVGCFMEFHKLRMSKFDELYECLPEAKMDKVFRIFYNLWREGGKIENVPNNILPLQRWDEDVLKNMRAYCQEPCTMNYLLKTQRMRNDIAIPLNMEQRGEAVDFIKDILDHSFKDYFK